MLEFDKKDLKFIGPCPVCKSSFAPQNIKALKSRGAILLLHVDCHECESSLLVTLIKSNTGVITNVGVLTDLNKDDFSRFRDMPVITINDVLYFDSSSDNKNDNFRTKK
ncbi:hypothetical protein A2819_02755 [Candidatus Azambacteria bacterium RIFCSPHIGHO2_01_FULL_40_24]|uniref:Uncharacterized protein n=1 Tax=Candidatus Azambacteria bacterium RIFCSPHIGHO2_01_FULL_40_24 TaxID=1797301 RepID=A0A1F5B2V3_9BACT|nr:MAG: hypothetical protein A2819_02755 [Candidatus Azambacteria bacterium RIFCSPHIGHO2_01_FULL_40_24]